MERKKKYAGVRLNKKEVAKVADILGAESYKTMDFQCVVPNGVIYMVKILEAADYIREQKFKFYDNPKLQRKEGESVNGWMERIVEDCAKLPASELKRAMSALISAASSDSADSVRRSIRLTCN